MRKKMERLLSGIVLVLAVAALVYYTGSASKERRDLSQVKLRGGSERDNRLIGEADLARLYPDLILREARGQDKTVALTFDDGPDRVYTPLVLDVLREKGVRATFFLIGNRIEEYSDVVERIINEGHVVGNHTYTHPEIDKASGSLFKRELSLTEEALARFGLSGSGFFRPPYGAISPSLVEEAGNLGYRVAMWSVDSLDWRGLPKDQVIANVVPLVVPGSVVLQHSAGGPGEDLSGSVEALPEIIDTLRASGYRFVTLAEMFPPTATVSQSDP
ncbi:MAG: polysaccharide deacetylase family protein [Bacillota bacterium]